MAARVRTKAVVIEGIEKRLRPTKHYVYTIRVEMSDQSNYPIWRRYKEFLRLQAKLCSLFPKEIGRVDKAERFLPFIPGKAASGQNHLRSTAIERISHLEEFCKGLVQLPDHISQCLQVKEFFARKAEDDVIFPDPNMTSATTNEPQVPWNERLPSNSLTYRVREAFNPDGKHSKSQIPLSKGEIVEVIEKLYTGWWYVEADYGQGWVPASCLEDPSGRYEDDTKVYATLGLRGKPYIVTKYYRAAASDELSIRQGTIVTVLEKKSDGWWLAEYEGVHGLVPGCFLAQQNAAKGIKLIKEFEAVPSVNQLSSVNVKEDLQKVNGTATERPKPKPKPPAKPRRSETSPFSSPLPSTLPSPLPSPVPAHRPDSVSQQSVYKENSSLESSSDEEEDGPSVQERPKPPPSIKASLMARKVAPTEEKKFCRVCGDDDSVDMATSSVKKGREVQVMSRPHNHDSVEIKVDGQKGFAPKEKTKKPSRKTRDKQKCDIQDIEDAFWSEDAIEGERVLHMIAMEGTFMIRKSQSREKQETLLVYEEGKIIKYKIKEKQGTGFSLSMTSPNFESLEELIFYYSTNDLPQATAKLKAPYQRLVNTY